MKYDMLKEEPKNVWTGSKWTKESKEDSESITGQWVDEGECAVARSWRAHP